MVEVEIDLGMLEDMCSDLEEFAILTDNDSKVLWMNSVLKSTIDMPIRDDYTDSKKILSECEKLFGGVVSNNSLLKKVFVAGKLLKSAHIHNNVHVKMISIPIKYGSDVLYSLNIIETHQKDIHEKDIHEKYIHQKDISQNTALTHKDTETDSENTKNKVFIDLLQFFLDSSNKACFIVHDNKIINTSKKFDHLFKKNDVLKSYLYDNVHLYHKDLSHLRKLFKYSYNIFRKPVIKEKKCIGHVYFLENKIVDRSVSKKKDLKKIPTHKRAKSKNKRSR